MLRTFTKLFLLVTALTLVTGTPDECVSSINSMIFQIMGYALSNQTAKILSLPLISLSGKGINDLGSYELCRNTQNTSYVSVFATPIGVAKSPYASFVIGICGPANCTASDYENTTVQDTLKTILSLTGSYIPFNVSDLLANVTLATADPNGYPPVNFSSVIAFLIVGIPILLTVVASFIRSSEESKNSKQQQRNDNSSSLHSDDEEKPKRKTIVSKIVDCWAIQDNAIQLFYPQRTAKHDSSLDIFNGIRFLSILWVILGHEYVFNISFIANYRDLQSISSNWFLNIVASGFFAVDAFFYLSGFFAAFVLYSKLKAMKAGVVTYCGVIFHRFIRIIPIYLFVMMFYWKVSVYFGSGPLWGLYVGNTKACDTSWWQNLLFVDIWVRDPPCISWGWYLSNDMTMFLASPILVWIYLKNAKYGLSLLGVLLFGSLSLGMYYSFVDEMKAGPGALQKASWWNDIYVNPLVRVQPYFVGTILALVYRSFKQDGKTFKDFALKIKSSALAAWTLELLGIALISLLVWLPRMVQTDPTRWPDWFHSTFMGSGRFLFGVGLALISTPTLAGAKTCVTTILGAPFWSPLATLTFAVYLIHLVVFFMRQYSERATFFFDNGQALWNMLGVIVMSVLAALFLYLVVEAPFAKLEGAAKAQNNRVKSKDKVISKEIGETQSQDSSMITESLLPKVQIPDSEGAYEIHLKT